MKETKIDQIGTCRFNLKAMLEYSKLYKIILCPCYKVEDFIYEVASNFTKGNVVS